MKDLSWRDNNELYCLLTNGMVILN